MSAQLETKLLCS